MEINESVSDLEGTILWICRSSLRKNHPRKNWYIDVSVLNETEEIKKAIVPNQKANLIINIKIRIACL